MLKILFIAASIFILILGIDLAVKTDSPKNERMSDYIVIFLHFAGAAVILAYALFCL